MICPVFGIGQVISSLSSSFCALYAIILPSSERSVVYPKASAFRLVQHP